MKKLSINRPVAIVKKGFTLIEALIVIVLIGLLAGLLVSTFNPNGSKGTILFNNTIQLRDAIKRASLDLGYPAPNKAGSLKVLFDSVSAQNAANFSSNSLPNNWKGPYLDALPTATSGNPIFADIGATTEISLVLGTSATAGPYTGKTPYILSVANVPFGIAAEAVRACLNIGSNVAVAGNKTDAQLVGHNKDFDVGGCNIPTGTVGQSAVFQVVVGA